ncbi:hypothetical protein NUW54_g10014 [Trametes sanguinea]|uniref:Uncharacterized protein n=1 Tax=Trametes sanguinea TaxID=158606 RepID=A0ACC1P3D8_9APHY|nr:hypothetical protein NUW54_g10014 [Trametes sanguinea]
MLDAALIFKRWQMVLYSDFVPKSVIVRSGLVHCLKRLYHRHCGCPLAMGKRRKDRTVHYRFDDHDDDDIGDYDPDLPALAPISASTSTVSLTHQHVDYSYNNRRPSVRNQYIQSEESIAKQARVEPTVEQNTARPDPSNLSSFQDGVDLNYLYSELGINADDEASRQRRAGDRPLLRWRTEIDTYLGEMLRLEGRGDFTEGICYVCKSGAAAFHCDDCFGHGLLCAACMVSSHHRQPLHRIAEWREGFFCRSTLKGLGLRIQLGHEPGTHCVNPKPAYGDDFIVLDIFGVHEVAVDFCNCEQVLPHPVQLLRARWYPATSINPKTAATFRLLENFHLLSTQSKISGYEFYVALGRATDNTGTAGARDRYPAFMDMVRQWRHLKMLKRSGRGFDKDAATTTAAGECAVECPACPHPGKNLPDDWQDAPDSRRYVRLMCRSESI